jgi:acetylornithine deacetylase
LEPVEIPKIELDSFEHLLSELVSSSSISSPDAAWDQPNEKVIRVLERWFASLGFNTEVMDVNAAAGKYNLIATLGAGANGLVLGGHTDTVPYDSKRWSSDPFSLKYEAGKFFGLGTCDMKGFFPTIIEALRGLQGMKLKQPLIVLATADEESTMAGARTLAKRGGLQARAAVIGEPTQVRPVRAHKGILMESIQITGKSGHSSNPALGNNAIEAMHSFMYSLIEFRGRLQSQYRNPMFTVDMPTLNLGKISGGDSPNRTCGHCALSFDLRPLPGMDVDLLRQEVSDLASKTGLERCIQIEHKGLIEPVPAFETPKDSELVKFCEGISGELSQAVAFATEAPFLSSMGMETVVMGAGSIDQAHQPNEYLDDRQVEKMANVLSGLIKRYCSEEGHDYA